MIAAGLLLWLAHSSLGDEQTTKAKGKLRLASIGSDVLAMRDADAPLLPVRDPLGIRITEPAPPVEPEEPQPDVPEPGPRPEPVYTPEQYASAWSDALRGLVTDAADALSGWNPLRLESLPAPAEPPPPPPVPFTLVLDATVGQGGQGLARISGQTVAVGQPVLGMDPRTPPVLESVHGTTAIVRYRDKRLVLDLDVRPRLDIAGGSASKAPDGEGP